MSKVITIKEANISTLSVELKAIHINTKQMTLSVFRQIPEEKLYDSDFKLQGIPWGNVNYFWDKCPKENSTTLHTVLQKDNELRRCRVNDIITNDWYSSEHTEKGIIARFCYDLNHTIDEITTWLTQNYCTTNHYYKEYGTYRPESIYSKESEAYKKAEAAKKEILENLSLCKDEVKKQRNYALAYIANQRQFYQKIVSLPQLYIAA